MSSRSTPMQGAGRSLASVLVLVIAALSRPAPAGEVPALQLAQEDADGQPALPRLTAGAAPEPLLTFELSVTSSCPDGQPRPELVVSVADTTRVLALQRARQTLGIEVPMGQLQWLANPLESCNSLDGKRAPDATGDGGTRLFRLHAVTAAFATLMCYGNDGRATGTSSALPLDAWLACPVAGAGP